LKKLFVDGRTYGRTDVRTDIFPLYTIRSTFGSRPKKQHTHFTALWTWTNYDIIL